MKDKLHKILRKWYKGYEDEAPNNYLEGEILKLIKESWKAGIKHTKYFNHRNKLCECFKSQ
jgi:hypothetical protein